MDGLKVENLPFEHLMQASDSTVTEEIGEPARWRGPGDSDLGCPSRIRDVSPCTRGSPSVAAWEPCGSFQVACLPYPSLKYRRALSRVSAFQAVCCERLWVPCLLFPTPP